MTTLINAFDIQSIIPHRYPLQLVDKVIHYVPGKEITAVKAVTIGEAFFSGHFPELPIMPGVLIIEALAQATSILLELTEREWNPGDKIKPVHPGCFLYLHARLDWKKDKANSLKVEACVDNELCAQGSIVVALKEKLEMI